MTDYNAAEELNPEGTPPAGDTRSVLTAQEVADLLQVSYKVIIAMAKDGEIPAFRIANQWRFLRADVDRWLQVMSRQEYKGPTLGDDNLVEQQPDQWIEGPITEGRLAEALVAVRWEGAPEYSKHLARAMAITVNAYTLKNAPPTLDQVTAAAEAIAQAAKDRK